MVTFKNIRNKVNMGLFLTLGVALLTGCGASKDTEPDAAVFDEAMAQAHFLSAIQADEGKGPKEDITDYVASCKVTAKGDVTYLVLGDRTGEYGTLFLVGAGNFGDEDRAVIKSYRKGAEDGNYYSETTLGQVSGENGEFDLKVAVHDGRAAITVSGKELEAVDMPFESLGCVGAYKGRGMSDVYMDDMLVEADGKTIFAEDFDGNFVNELYAYDYAGEQESVFSPFYYRTEDVDGSKALVVSSGLLLSETEKDAAPVFRKQFDVKKKDVKSAHLVMTALGSFEATINGVRASENFFDPGKMLFDAYLNYVTYDVTELLEDQNELRLYLYHGFYDKGVGYPEVAGIWGEKLAVKGALVIDYKNGKRDIIPTDESFEASTTTRYRFNDIYQGEIIDDRYNEDDSFGAPEVDGIISAFQKLPIYPKEQESISSYKTLSPISVTEPVPGHYVYDFGENFAGVVSIDLGKLGSAYGQEGQVLTLRYGEILNSDSLVNSDGPEGTVWTRNLLTARATDYYVFGGAKSKNAATFSHTYHGFRYLEITGAQAEIPVDAISAMAISSDLETTGTFTCSDETINAFYENSVRSLRSNLMDSPTDCPQRDERLGWTGDAQAVSGFAMYQFDSKNLYNNYLKEIRGMQNTDGAIYDVAPATSCFGGHSCWGDAIVTIPWNLYLQYGDKEVLAENVDAASRWVDYLVEKSDDYLFSSGGYGDHLSTQSLTEEVTDTAWCAHSSRLLSRMYSILGDEENSSKYGEVADNFTRRWQENFIRDDYSVEAGILQPDYESETAYSLGLSFGLFPEDMRQAAADRLGILSEYGGYLFYPGYSGMAFYLPSLCEYGHGDVAAQVMKNTAPGGLAHLISMGLTTNAESVDALRYNEEYGEGRYYINGSLNHAAYSSVSKACYEYILGIQPDEAAPGFEHFYVRPMMTSGIASASGSYESVRGRISVSYNSDERSLTVEVPKDSTCTVILQGGETQEVSAGVHSFNW